ncbi:conserved protein of unknown function [Rhodovastum atsumiense]|uniref:Uncharacterized protein n=1 Tax=Rhodovastum atsumiense TaxID=504468 RepID=A0A5M6IYF8_9PROT|nr:glycosyltransferase family 2 protein [Rhodovastum atsumiense]KAA5613380.1 hypothetical protein F1189_04780 [Rhodovastum atsumiense]CAH2603061.1 conserved protein of unknown function [Rhodovastum atsumiense]
MTKPPSLPYDTYFALLEKPELRQIGLTRYGIRHRTPLFSQSIYFSSSGAFFKNQEEAYIHWLTVGRREGYEWAPGRDTLLKIILKAKDEPYLIDAWIAHHAAIVGFDNIIILDCGSQDPTYIAKLKSYSSKIMIFDYRRHYDDIHNPSANADFFRLLAANCRYLTILDADEFLFARVGGLFSSQFVKQVLRNRNLPMFCGIWVTAINGSDGPENICSIDTSTKELFGGTIAGKAIARHDIIFSIGHLGHNLHVPQVLPFINGDSFGEIFVLHLRNLPQHVMRERALQHLIGKGVVNTKKGPEQEARIALLAEAGDTPADVKRYAQAYLRMAGEPPAIAEKGTDRAALINSTSGQCLPSLATALAKMNWGAILEERRIKLRGAA